MWFCILLAAVAANIGIVQSDSCRSYSTLSGGSRSITSQSSSCQGSDRYLAGWFRFAGPAGDTMLNFCPYGKNTYGQNTCGAQEMGWFTGSLPYQYEGEVSRTAYTYVSNYCYRYGHSIKVRNCGSFYVFYLASMAASGNCGRYCGSGRGLSSVVPLASVQYVSTISVQPSPVADSCQSYSILSDGSRSATNSSGCTGDDDAGLRGWYRFMGEAGDSMASNLTVRYYYCRCGAELAGSLQGSHPSQYEGEVHRTVIFISMYGETSPLPIKVRNCGGFNVYYLDMRKIDQRFRNTKKQFCGTGSSMAIAPTVTSIFETAAIRRSAIVEQRTTTGPKVLDGCRFYQLLSDNTRAITYGDMIHGTCDDKLYGWYRFTGNAGNRMLDKCPSLMSTSQRYKCGSYMQGWLTSASMPSTYEGEVSRMVCFSDFYSCRCQYQTQVKVRNCGQYYVYWLNGVPACNQRYCGVKDDSASISCSENYMRIDLDRKQYNASAYSSITLRDPSCLATLSRNHISLSMVPSLCKSSRTESRDYIVYENEVIMTAKRTNGLITRNTDQRIRFSCSYNKNGFVSSVSFKPITSVNVTESGFGNFSYYFRMYTDRSYSRVNYVYPVKTNVRDWLYFEAYASVSDKSLVVLLDQCYSTPTMDRAHPDKYVFINNGCPLDETVLFQKTTGDRQRFSIQAFRYLQNSTAVYLHCVVFLCHQSSSDYRCRSGCTGNNVNRVRRSLQGGFGYDSKPATYSKYNLLEAGPFILGDDKASGKQGKQGADSSFSTTTVILIVGVAAMAIVVAGLVIKMRRQGTAPDKAVQMGVDNALPGNQFELSGEAPMQTGPV